MQICSESEWGSTSTVLMFMLYWREQMIGNLHVFASKDEANTYSEHLIHSNDDVSIYDPTELYLTIRLRARDFYEVIVDEGEARINYHPIEIKSE